MIEEMIANMVEKGSPNEGRTIISVIVPVHEGISRLLPIRESVHTSNVIAELIIVINSPELVGKISPEGPSEIVVVANRTGRGYAFIEGAKIAKGDISLLLHSDTMLPNDWDSAIIKAMSDPKAAGGAFSRSFDKRSAYLQFLLPLGSLFSWVLGDVWGDRGIFLRTGILRECLQAIDVPIMEDVRLGKCMRKHGKVRLLRETVITSADAFRKHGNIRHTVKFLKCRVWYALGGDLDKIFDYYYSER
jgi:hypothetical protein